MADEKGTELENGAGTGGNDGNPAGTGNENSSPATQNDDNKELVRQRDRANEKARTLDQEVAELRGEVAEIRGEKDKGEFLDSLVKKYPGVDREALEFTNDPESAEALAKKLVAMKETSKEEALKELQNVEQNPRLDPETAATKLKELEGTGRLEDVFEIKMGM